MLAFRLVPSIPILYIQIHPVLTRWGIWGLPQVLRTLGQLDRHALVVHYALRPFHPTEITFAMKPPPILSVAAVAAGRSQRRARRCMK